jgi:uncharacterized protein (TIGR02391 family)
MTRRWDNIEILQAIDRLQSEAHGGGPLTGVTGLSLMQQIDNTAAYPPQSMRGFVQELRIAADIGLLSFRSDRDTQPNLADSDPNWYLQTIWDFALTVQGQDRARGRAVVQPPPDPSEDDGRQLSDLILRQIADAITQQYAPDEVVEFLGDEGIPPTQLALPDGTGAEDTYSVLAALWRWGSEGRRLFRQFVGRWLDDQLLSGPDAELRAQLIEQLARQGWRIREVDSMLVIGEPVRGIPVGAPFLRASRLHALIEVEARSLFLINQPAQGVFASMKAVEIRVRGLCGLGDDVIGVDLMNRAFGPGGPLADPSAPKGEQEGTRALFVGAYAVLRNPAGHRQIDYEDVSEAAEAVQTSSLLMRLLDRAERRLVAAGRGAAFP